MDKIQTFTPKSTLKITRPSPLQELKTVNQEYHTDIKKIEEVDIDSPSSKTKNTNMRIETEITEDNHTIEYQYESDKDIWKYKIERDSQGNIVKMHIANETEEGYQLKEISKDYKEISETNYDKDWNVINNKQYIYDENNILINTIETNRVSTGIYLTTTKDNQGNVISTNLNFDYYKNCNVTANNNLTKISGTSIQELLGPEEIQNIQNKIIDAVNNCQDPSQKVVMPITILISELADKGYYLPYYYGGGHGSTTYGVDGSLGSTTTPTGESTIRNIKSYDCSGLVNWTINTALGINNGDWSYTGGTTRIYMDKGTPIDRASISTGDVFSKTSHIFLVLDTYTDSNGNLRAICAESHADGWLSDNSKECTDGMEIVDYIVDDIPESYQLYNLDSYYSSLFNGY